MEQPVVTPEAVALEFPLASVGSRFLAFFLDAAIQVVTLLVVLLAVGVAADLDGDRGVVVALAYLLAFLVVFGYPVGFETLRRGRTPGKAALGLRVMTREGGPERFRHAAIRAALGLVDFALTAGAAAVVTTLVTRDSQRLGDIVAGTVVVRERTGLRAPAPVTFAVPPGLESYVASLDPAGLSSADSTTVRAFLVRAPSLPADARRRIATTLAATVAERLRTTPPADAPPETFLQAVFAVQQARAAGVTPPSREALIDDDAPPPPPPAWGGEFAPPT